MVFLGIGWVFPQISSSHLALASWLVAVRVELSQLIQTPWLVAIRQTTVGHLALGSTFYWPDLAAYTIGIVLAFYLEITVLRSGLGPS